MTDESTDRSKVIEHVAAMHQRLYVTLLSSLTENWMSTNYTMPQIKILLFLYINGPYRVSDLASVLGVTVPTTTGVLDRLVGLGVLSRSHDTQDRRVVTCKLTAEGEQHISALWLAKFEVFREIFDSLTSEELDVVSNAIQVVLEAASRRGPGVTAWKQGMGTDNDGEALDLAERRATAVT